MAGHPDAGGDNGDGRDGGLVAAGDVRDKLILALMAVILGGGGAASYLGVKDPRPDPFTGTMGKELESRLQGKIDQIAIDCKAIDARLQQHLVRGEAGFYRIDRLEHDVRQIEKRFDK